VTLRHKLPPTATVLMIHAHYDHSELLHVPSELNGVPQPAIHVPSTFELVMRQSNVTQCMYKQRRAYLLKLAAWAATPHDSLLGRLDSAGSGSQK
jgi:hypothetical protein